MILSAQRMQYFQGKPEYLSKIIIHLHQVWFPLKKWVPFYNPWKNPTNLCKLSKKDTVKLLEPIINLCWWVWEKQNFCLDSANSKSVLKTINAKSNFCYELRQAIAKSDTRTFSEWLSFFRDHFLYSKKGGIRSNPIESGPEDGFSDENSASNFFFTKNFISKDCVFRTKCQPSNTSQLLCIQPLECQGCQGVFLGWAPRLSFKGQLLDSEPG